MSQPTPYFTCGTLAAFGKGLPSYAGAADNKDTAIKNAVQKDGRCCSSVSLAFTLLAIVFAGGGSVLLAFSGGPNNLALFVPGAAFGGLSAAFSLGLVAVIAQAIRFRKARKAQLLDYSAQRIDDQTVLSDMQKANLDQVKHVFRAASPELREHFLLFVHSHYFGKDQPRLDEKQERVLAALASHPDAFLSLDPKTLDRQFILYLAKYVDQAQFSKPENTHAATQFLKQLSRPKNEEELSILARHPKILVNWVFKDEEPNAKENLANEVVIDTVTRMEEAEIAEFLKESRPILSDKAVSSDRRQQMTKIIPACLERIVSPTLVERFLQSEQSLREEATEGEREEHSKLAKGVDALLTALGDYPTWTAQMVFQNKISHEKSFIDALETKFSEEAKGLFIRSACLFLKEGSESKEGRGTKKSEKVKEKEKKGGPVRELIAAQLKLPHLTLDVLAHYFSQEPSHFADCVLKNPSLEANADLALDLLERMEDEFAAPIIKNLDKDQPGFDNFNLLVQKLMQELGPSEKSRIGPSRGRLMARFRYAPQSSKESILDRGFAFLGVSFKSLTPLSLEAFDAIAKPYEKDLRAVYAK